MVAGCIAGISSNRRFSKFGPKPSAMSYWTRSRFGFFVMICLLSCADAPTKEKLLIPAGKVGVIGYGSLTSKEQMQKQLGEPYEEEVRIVHLEGYQRRWNAILPNNLPHPPVGRLVKCVKNGDTIVPEAIVNLNIQAAPDHSMNACFFILDEADLITLDRTEKGYKRIEVGSAIREFEVVEGIVYAYQAMPHYQGEPDLDQPFKQVIPAVYLGFLEAAYADLGEAYQREFEASTQAVPESITADCFIAE